MVRKQVVSGKCRQPGNTKLASSRKKILKAALTSSDYNTRLFAWRRLLKERKPEVIATLRREGKFPRRTPRPAELLSPSEASHIALKCTYNDCGEGRLVGFVGTCSDANMQRNVKLKRTWCSDDDSECAQYVANHCRGKRPVSPCYESRLFKSWQFGCGMYHNGPRRDLPIPVKRAVPATIAILTTRFPGEEEDCRRIIGAYLIESVERNLGESVKLVAHPTLRIRLPLAVARKLYFWRFYDKENDFPQWGCGLFRYVDHKACDAILTAISKRMGSPKSRRLIEEMRKRAIWGHRGPGGVWVPGPGKRKRSAPRVQRH